LAGPLLLLQFDQELLEEGAIIPEVKTPDGRRAIPVGGLEEPQEPGPAIGADRLCEALEGRPVHAGQGTLATMLAQEIPTWVLVAAPLLATIAGGLIAAFAGARVSRWQT
jgi:hypothetical protein